MLPNYNIIYTIFNKLYINNLPPFLLISTHFYQLLLNYKPFVDYSNYYKDTSINGKLNLSILYIKYFEPTILNFESIYRNIYFITLYQCVMRILSC